MSDPEDNESEPRKRVRTGGGSGTGRSGTARSIGAELGGLDFEPDALLDSLLADDEGAAEQAAPQITELAPASRPGQKLLEPDQRLYSPEEVTLVGNVKDGSVQIENAPGPADADAVDELLASPEPPPAPPRPPPRRPPPVPRPAARPPAPPRPPPPPRAQLPSEDLVDEGPTLADFEFEEIGESSFQPLGGGTLASEEGVDDVARPQAEIPTAPPPPPDDEIAFAGEMPDKSPLASAPSQSELYEADDDATVVRPPPASLADFALNREVDAMLGAEGEVESEELAVEEPVVARPVPARSERPRSRAPGDERPAAAHLSERGLLETWTARAEWIEMEAQNIADPHARARALVVASELWAMAGDVQRAREVASEAGAVAASMPVVQRQLRHLAAADEDWRAVVGALETETRASPTIDARAHAAHLSSEIHRLVLRDEVQAQKKVELLSRTAAMDARAQVVKLASQLGTSAAPPKMRWPEGPGLTRLIAAWHEIVRLRGGELPPDAGAAPPGAAVRFEEARRALSNGDRAAAGEAIAALATIPGLELAAPWLAAALLCIDAATRPRAIELLGSVVRRERSGAALRALAYRALEQGDASAVAVAVSAGDGESGDAFTAADRVALAVLTGGERETVQPWLAVLAGDEQQRPLATAASSTTLPADVVPDMLSGSERSRTEVALGRALLAASGGDGVATFRMAHEAFQIMHEGDPLARSIALELALGERAADRVAAALSGASHREGDHEAERDRHLAASVVYELAGDGEQSRRELGLALEADPRCEASVRALIADASRKGAAALLTALADAEPEPTARAILLTEAALRLGPEAGDRYQQLLEQAAETLPTLPLAHRLAEQLARARGDIDGLLGWLRVRRDGSADAVERALDMVREALLVAETDFDLATTLLEEACAARPHDVALRELHERLAGGSNAARGTWREEVAAEIEGPQKPRLLLEAALEYERAGDMDKAARAAAAAAEADGGELARLVAERTGAAGNAAAALAERLFAEAREEQDPVAQRELYERLSQIDSARGEASSALLWHSAIFERTPSYLPALRRLEHAYISDGRDEELEPVAAALAAQLDRGEATAHALIASRLRIRAGRWGEARELVELAARQDTPSLWALRAESAHARAAGDDAAQLRADRQLSERANRAIDAATLALRAAEAATRLGQMPVAKELLDRAVEMVPEHPIALTTLAEVLEATGDHRGAAEAMETVAASTAVEAHRLQAWYSAGVTWIDRVGDSERGRVALERAADIELEHEDLFTRLQALYVAAGERGKLAELLERRLAATESPEERVALEITRGRALAEIGDHAAAKQALAAALDANPDNSDALDAFAGLCVAEGDWSGAEQAWIRLARHVTEPEQQAEIYRKLGHLYDTDLANPQRAELSYKEVLKRQPNDTAALERLVHVYGRLGDGPKAIAIATELMERASTPEEKRDRTIALALAHEQVLGDRRKAEGILDKARRSWPQDGTVLRATAEFHERGGETKALGMLLDRAANDARRALSTGRFDPSFFEILATVAELRGGADAAAGAKATLAALEGQDSAMRGAGAGAGDPRLDELLAPELLSLPLRVLLKKAGDALDAAYPVDLGALRAAPLPAESAAEAQQIAQVASAFGLHSVEVLVSPALGSVCMPVSSAPPRVVFGRALLDSGDEQAISFALVRALKILQGRAAALSRLPPIELWPVMAAFLSQFAPNWQPPNVDAKRMADAQQRIRPAMPRQLDDDVPVLALEVIGSIGNRASQLALGIGQWGDRTALLAIGDPNAAIRGIAMAGGHDVPTEGPDRLKWIVRNPEARDLAVFSVSEQYAEARRRLSLS